MSILSWLKTVTHGEGSSELIAATPMHFAPGEEEFHGLNMKEALDTHLKWVQRLEQQMGGVAHETVDIVHVAGDHNCVLGKWIHGAAKRQFGELPAYAELRQAHADFHIGVGAILNDVQNGDTMNVESGMKKIRHQSGMVQLALIRLYSTGA